MCDECAAKSGININGAMSLTDILVGLGAIEETGEGEEKSCPFCHLKLGEFRKDSRLGCAVCYDVFGSELKSLLSGMQKGNKHIGKVPRKSAASSDRNARVEALEKELDEAVAAEDFERAAGLRDAIKAEMSAKKD